MGPGQDLRRKALRVLAGEIWVGNGCGSWYIGREAGPHAHDDVGANTMGLLAGIVAAFAVDAGYRDGVLLELHAAEVEIPSDFAVGSRDPGVDFAG
jgi:hypothetical protein